MTYNEFASLGEKYNAKFVLLEKTTSTNIIANEKIYSHGDIIFALEQSDGKGQRGNHWCSTKGANITFSLVVEPTFLPASHQFLLSESIALGISDMLCGMGLDTKIKWTNDIYIDGCKVAGVLIEHDICGSNIARSVIGIGLNVNQTDFDPSLPNPISLKGITGIDSNIFNILETLYQSIMARYNQLKLGDVDELSTTYNSRLYRKGEQHTYYLSDGTPIEGVILGVKDSGELIVKHSETSTVNYLFKEIEFKIK